MTLVEFLTARLNEEEAVARDATPGPWFWQDLGPGRSKQALVSHEGNGLMVVPSRTPDVYPSHYDARFMERFNPARILADIAAKRAIIQRYENACRHADGGGDDEAVRSEWGVIASTYEQVLCEHAAVSADHADYQQEWKP